MDPDATLAQLRELVADVLAGRVELLDAGEIMNLFESLDLWLSRGGRLPAAWAR